MNDFDLKAKLKAVRVPQRSDEYWDDFSSRVRMQLGRPAPAERARWHGRPGWEWNRGLALACLLLFISLVPLFHAVFKDGRLLRREASQLPQTMRGLMADEHGMQNLVMDKE